MWLEQHNARMELEPLGALDSFLSLRNKQKKGGVVSSTGTSSSVVCGGLSSLTRRQSLGHDSIAAVSAAPGHGGMELIWFLSNHILVSNQRCRGWEPVTASLVGEFKSLGLWHLITFTCSIGHPVQSVQLRELMRHGGGIRHRDLFACAVRTFKPRAASSAVECRYQEVCVTHGFLVTQQDWSADTDAN